MRNYKVNAIIDRDSYFGCKTFTDEQIKLLLSMGFSYDAMFKSYTKIYPYGESYGLINMKIMCGETYLRFYNYRYVMPCELEDLMGIRYKSFMKNTKEDLKKLKDAKILI